jgi:peptidoglycan/xylan/chitin deacetylase (PgdA/CDA1 family)
MKFILIFLLSFSSLFAASCDFKSHQDLGQEIFDELQAEGMSCGSQSVHMTFDDGPTSSVTPQMLEELRLRNVKATFFITTQRLQGSPIAQQMVRDEMSQGHLIADHGYDHDAYDIQVRGDTLVSPGFSQDQRDAQIQKSYDLLNQATQGRFKNQKLLLYRFPYGRGAMPSPGEIRYMANNGIMKFISNDYGKQLQEYRRQSPALLSIEAKGFSHLGWNHDSEDSKYQNVPMAPQVLKDHIKNNLRALCAAKVPQVALFHDIKAFNLDVVPVVLDIGKCMGLKFISPDQMIAMKSTFVANHVLIQRSEIQRAPAKTLEDILTEISKFGEPEECTSTDDSEKSCYSHDYNKYYSDCAGGDSVCYRGKWFGAQDPLIKNKCPNR